MDQGVVESQHLEYKSALPGDTRDDRREFQRDVAALANGGGGILVYGLSEDDNDAAAELTPVPLGASVTRLRQLIGMIEPFLISKIHDADQSPPAFEGGSDAAGVARPNDRRSHRP